MGSPKKVASASGSTKKRKAAVTNEDVVTTYLARLEAALGDEGAFLPVFNALKLDSDVGQAEAVALASRFVARTAASTSRAQALERVWKRHASLVSFKLKQRAMAGRSAA